MRGKLCAGALWRVTRRSATPPGGLSFYSPQDSFLVSLYAATREAAITAFATRRAVNRVCLADQARGCEDDARDECSEAAIQQDFIKNLGHDSLHSRYTLTKR
jgi:hypothetical protein